MNKNPIIVAVLAMSLWGNQPIVAVDQSKSTIVDRAKKEYQAFMQALTCVRMQGFSTCSPAQKKRMVVAGIALAALLLTASYAGYRTMRVPELQKYIDQVKANLHSPNLVAIQFDFSKISQFKVDPWQRKLQALLDVIIQALKRGSSLDLYYEDLNNTYRENFSMLVSTFGVDYNKLYEFLGTTEAAGKAMSHDEIQGLINEKLQALGATKTKGDITSLKRQLGYIFGSNEQKKQYDAFLGGKNGLGVTHKEMSEAQQERLEAKIEEIAVIMSNLP